MSSLEMMVRARSPLAASLRFVKPNLFKILLSMVSVKGDHPPSGFLVEEKCLT
jgi:hypothetical protein